MAVPVSVHLFRLAGVCIFPQWSLYGFCDLLLIFVYEVPQSKVWWETWYVPGAEMRVGYTTSDITKYERTKYVNNA